MMVRLLFVLLLLTAATAATASADDSGQANQLLVESVKLIQQAHSQETGAAKLPLLEQALANLNAIIEQHPSTDLAVKLITNQPLGNLSLQALTREIEALRERIAEQKEREAEQKRLEAERQAEEERLKAEEEAEEIRKRRCLESLDMTDPACHEWTNLIVRIRIQGGDLDGALATVQSADTELSKDDAFRNLSGALARARRIDEATKMANSITNSYKRASALLFVTRIQAADGDLKHIQTLAEQAKQGTDQDRILAYVIEEQIRAGQFADALISAKRITGTDRRNGEIRQVASGQLEAGLPEDALITAKEVESHYTRNSIYRDVAEHYARAGQLETALRTADLATDKDGRPISNEHFHQELRVIAQASAGNFAEALTIAQAISHGPWREGAIKSIAQAHLDAGDPDAALDTLGHAHQDTFLTGILGSICQRYLEAGEAEKALAVAATMDTVFSKGRVIYHHLNNENFAPAIEIIASVDDSEERDRYYAALADSQARAGNTQAALAAAELIQDLTDRSSTKGVISVIREQTR